jgi:cation diffusion facilitator CzcD-associated flavoprotein CzcO
VIAAGIVRFAYLPPLLSAIPGALVSHSSQHSDLSGFKARKVAVLGAGASALDIAALLLEGGADVELVARRQTIQFHDPPNEPRPLLQRLMAPRSGLGTELALANVHGYSNGFSRDAAIPARQGGGATSWSCAMLVCA